jgi:hypothetical protein
LILFAQAEHIRLTLKWSAVHDFFGRYR